MQRMLVISDIHGQIDKFEKLLDICGYDPKMDQLILLGDYIDRGQDSKAVIEKVMALKEQGVIVLKGNHEDLMEKAFQNQDSIRHWIRNGGAETLRSYGYVIEDSENVEQIAENLSELHVTETFKKHLDFVKNLDFFYETEEYTFVHGGVDPKTPISETDPYLLMWIREEFHSGYNGAKPVVFGHTPTDGFHDSHGVYFGSNNIIGIDGGCVYGGQLNCLELPSRKTYHIE